uniref:Lipocalin/cytosolic fatty-acid binding domain-containing protein n=1 Tax=Pundamilia nyererei TaxID=303518 RepID=A0A3B4F976_9CICH
AMASLRALLGVVLCSLMVSASEILPQADFDLQGIAGKWCLTGVCSNFKWFAVTKPTGSPAMVEPTEDATKTDMPGNFPVITPTKTGNIFFSSFLLLFPFLSVTGFVTEIYSSRFTSRGFTGRSLDLSAEEKFNQLCLQTGILPANILPSIHPSIQCFSSLFILYMK